MRHATSKEFGNNCPLGWCRPHTPGRRSSSPRWSPPWQPQGRPPSLPPALHPLQVPARLSCLAFTQCTRDRRLFLEDTSALTSFQDRASLTVWWWRISQTTPSNSTSMARTCCRPRQASDTPHEAGAWITVSSPHLTIPAHSQFNDNFTVTLPAAVSPGEHRGAIVASAIVGKSLQGSTLEARTALITVITVPGAVKPSALLSALSRSAAGPRKLGFDITLSNTGNLLLTYSGTVDVIDGVGHKVASLPLTPPDAYVVPAGKAALAAFWTESIPESGNYRARATVTILARGRPVATLTSQSLELPFFSWPPILLKVGITLLVLILLASMWPFVRRGRRRRRARPGTAREGGRTAA
jgi:hypothetical protein